MGGGYSPPSERAGGCQRKSSSTTLRVAGRRGWGGKEKEWNDCVPSDVRAFGIAGNAEATTLEAEVWVETAMEGRRRFMAAAWGKEEEDAPSPEEEIGE